MHDVGVSPWSLQLLCLRNDEGEVQITPGIRVELSLCNLSPFFRMVSEIMPVIQCYDSRFYRINSHMRQELMKPTIRISQKKTVEFGGFGNIGLYPYKIIYIEGMANENLQKKIGELAVKPLVVCNESQVKDYEKYGCCVLSFDEATSPKLNSEIRTLAKLNWLSESLPHLDPALVEPILQVVQHPEAYIFESSSLPPIPTHNSHIALPNELLANQMRRVFDVAPGLSSQNANIVQLQMESMQLVFQQQAVDALLSIREDGLLTAHGLEKAIDSFLITRNGVAYERLVNEKNITNGLPLHLALWVPCINKTLTTEALSRRIPSRLLRLLFGKEDANFGEVVLENWARDTKDIEMLEHLIETQKQESEFISNLQCLYTLAERSPSIRVPRVASSFHGKLREIRQRYQEKNVPALNRAIAEFGVHLRDALPRAVIEFIRDRRPHTVRLFSDLPLEWLDVDGVPLNCICYVSRVPLTPGGLTLGHYMQAENELRLGLVEARRLLIVNCLQQVDPLFNDPKNLSRVFSDHNIEHTYVEASSLESYKALLSEHKPFILIHFGHGTYDRAQNSGYLQFRESYSKLWDMKGSYIPPIVLLGSCDTAALAETHTTPANAFLALGSRAVLGTLLPVQADRTVEMFLHIISSLMEAISTQNRRDNWSTVVGSSLLISRYKDELHGFNQYQARRKAKPAPPEVGHEFLYQLIKKFGSITREAYERFAEILASSISYINKEVGDEFRQYSKLNMSVPHSMFFTHLGSPETIRIISSPGDWEPATQARKRMVARNAKDIKSVL